MSKFINNETKQYLKSVTNNTTQQQLNNIKERLDIESNDLTRLVENVNSLKEAQNQDRTDVFQALESAMRGLQNQLALERDYSNQRYHELVAAVRKAAKRELYVAIALSVGVILCLVKSLI